MHSGWCFTSDTYILTLLNSCTTSKSTKGSHGGGNTRFCVEFSSTTCASDLAPAGGCPQPSQSTHFRRHLNERTVGFANQRNPGCGFKLSFHGCQGHSTTQKRAFSKSGVILLRALAKEKLHSISLRNISTGPRLWVAEETGIAKGDEVIIFLRRA